MTRILKRFLKTVEAIRAATAQPIYAIHAVRYQGRFGLYGRDFFSREPFRRKLMRQGVEFAEDPYVLLNDEGSFHNTDWGEFKPSFAVMSVDVEEPGQVKVVGGASVLFNLLAMRVGKPSASDLSTMREAVQGLTAMGSDNPKALLRSVEELVPRD